MKYVKLMLLYNGKDETLGEIVDVPLGRIIPVSLYGKIFDLKNGNEKIEKCRQFSIALNGERQVVDRNVIYELRVPGLFDDAGKPVTFRYVFDEKAEKRVAVKDLSAESLPELILKLTVAGLVHSTDSMLPDIPQAILDLNKMKEEAAEKDKQIERLLGQVNELKSKIIEKENEISSLRDRTRPSGGERAKKVSAWKRMIENMFGSEDDESYEV